jgi:hypothetical protein
LERNPISSTSAFNNFAIDEIAKLRLSNDAKPHGVCTLGETGLIANVKPLLEET